MNGVGLSKPKSVDNNHNWLILLNFISEMRKIEMSPAQCRLDVSFWRLFGARIHPLAYWALLEAPCYKASGEPSNKLVVTTIVRMQLWNGFTPATASPYGRAGYRKSREESSR